MIKYKQTIYFNLIFILSLPFSNFAQQISKKIPIKTSEYLAFIELADERKNINFPNNDVYYFWYRSREIHNTRGGYEGRLLHGEFTSFYSNNELKEFGEFKNGLKSGIWKEWYTNGELKNITPWINGAINGRLKEYGLNGKLTSVSQFRNNTLNGRQVIYTDSSTVKIKKFRNGKEIIKDAKEKKIEKIKKIKSEKVITRKMIPKKQSREGGTKQERTKIEDGERKEKSWFQNFLKKEDEKAPSKVKKPIVK
jgi:MORN repeat variant